MLLTEQSRDGVAAATPLVLVPLGATEQHGPHLPLGTDSLIVDHVARVAAARVVGFDVMVAATMPVGYSHHHLRFGATATISAATYAAMLRELCESLLETCSSRLFLINGHGGNSETMQAVAKTVAAERGAMIGAGSYWNMASRELARCGVPTPQRVPGHAGAFETSMLMALRPDLVSADLPAGTPDPDLHDPDGFTIDSPTRRIGVLGRTDDPSSSTPEYGLAYVEAVISGVHRSLEEYWAQCETGEPVHDGVSSRPSGR